MIPSLRLHIPNAFPGYVLVCRCTPKMGIKIGGCLERLTPSHTYHLVMPSRIPSSLHCSFYSAGPALYLSVADLNNSSCARSNSASLIPDCSILLCFFSRLCGLYQRMILNYTSCRIRLTACCVLNCCATSSTSGTYS